VGEFRDEVAEARVYRLRPVPSSRRPASAGR